MEKIKIEMCKDFYCENFLKEKVKMGHPNLKRKQFHHFKKLNNIFLRCLGYGPLLGVYCFMIYYGSFFLRKGRGVI